LLLFISLLNFTLRIALYHDWHFSVISPEVTCNALYSLQEFNPTLEEDLVDLMIYFSIEGRTY